MYLYPFRWYKPEGIRPGWPPRSRTERYRLIRSAPSTGWVAASRWERTRPPALARPTGFKPGPAARQVSHPCEEGGGHDPQRANARPLSRRRRPPGRFTLQGAAPRPGVNRPGMAEDGAHDAHGVYPPPGFRPGPATWLVHPPRAEGAVLETDGVTRASLSGRAQHACLVHLPYRTADSNRKPPGPEPGASTKIGLVRLESDRPDSNRP